MKQNFEYMKNYLEKVRMTDAIGQTLEAYRWSHFVTLTTRYELTEKSARRLMERWFSRVSLQSAKWGAKETLIAWFCEPHKTRDSRHIHCLLLAKCTHKQLHQEWQIVTGAKKAGDSAFVRSLTYIPDFGASFYCAKYVTKGFSDWDIDFRHSKTLDEFRIEDSHPKLISGIVRRLPTASYYEIPKAAQNREQRRGKKDKKQEDNKVGEAFLVSGDGI